MNRHAAAALLALALLGGARAAVAQTDYLGEIRLIAFGFPMKGWTLCSGQLLPINQNQALYSLLGTHFGGNGQTNFQLPDMRDRVGVSAGQGPGLENYVVGQRGGEDYHTLTLAEMPAHVHAAMGDSAVGTSASPAGMLPARNAAAVAQYKAGAATAMAVNSTGSAGGGQAHENHPPFLGLYYLIALQGMFPAAAPAPPPDARPEDITQAVPDAPYIGEIRIVPYNFAPSGWLMCEGQLLDINQYNVLYNLIGTTYGGDGQNNFGLPDLRGRVPDGAGTGTTGYQVIQGELAGQEKVMLTVSSIPAHSHPLLATEEAGASDRPDGGLPARDEAGIPQYGTSSAIAMGSQAIASAGGGQAHENRPPFIALHYIIATEGIFPSQTKPGEIR